MRKRNVIPAILLNDGYRSEGESDINGKHVKWDAGYCITYVPYESTQVTKKLVDPTVAKAVEDTLADVCMRLAQFQVILLLPVLSFFA